MHSCIYTGQVNHKRYRPVAHEFSYRLYMLYLDLNELPELFKHYWLWSVKRPALARFRREDHLGERTTDLEDAVRLLVKDKTGIVLCGPIRLLTQLRYLGYGFNPVSFYYCFDENDHNVEVIVAEVNNTPWGEQHSYILPESQNQGSSGKKHFLLDKQFHVSPFMDMNVDYDWTFTSPGKRLLVHMKNYQHNQPLFDATLALHQQPINSLSLASLLVRYPLMSMKIISAIYFEAMRLWLKKTPFHSHPEKY